MELEDGQIYKSPFVFWPEKSWVLYGSGSVLFVFDLMECKLFKKIEYSEPNQFVRSIYIDDLNSSILVAFDDKSFHVYNSSLELLIKRTFSKKISFIASSQGNVVIGDLFGDISVVFLDLSNLPKIPDTCKIVVPFSHYSSITSSSISGNLLFTGNKDGKIVVHALDDLHQIKDMYLSHKMPICSLEVVDPNWLISLSTDNSLRFWSLSTGLELFRIVLEDAKCPPYHLNCSSSDQLLVVLLLDRILVVKFDFASLNVVSHSTFKLPFVAQSALFRDRNLLLFDHFSNLYQVPTSSLTPEGGKGRLGGDSRKVDSISVGGDVPLTPQELHKNEGGGIGVKVNVGKHINLD